MGKILFSLAFTTALLALASSEASAFVCQAVGARSVGWGRSFFIGEAKVIALSRCARRSGICTISYCVPGYFRGIDFSSIEGWLLARAATPMLIDKLSRGHHRVASNGGRRAQ